jgi:hypothetical protein
MIVLEKATDIHKTGAENFINKFQNKAVFNCSRNPLR